MPVDREESALFFRRDCHDKHDTCRFTKRINEMVGKACVRNR